MGLFKSKEARRQEQKEREEKLFKEFMKTRNLEGLPEKDKGFIDEIRQDLDYTTNYSVRGSEAEIAQAQITLTLVEQNWLIIKLLNEINQKLSK